MSAPKVDTLVTLENEEVSMKVIVVKGLVSQMLTYAETLPSPEEWPMSMLGRSRCSASMWF